MQDEKLEYFSCAYTFEFQDWASYHTSIKGDLGIHFGFPKLSICMKLCSMYLKGGTSCKTYIIHPPRRLHSVKEMFL